MANERTAQLRIIPIEFPSVVQLEYRLLDANGQPTGPASYDPAEKWSELKRRLFLSDGDFAGAEAVLRGGDPQPLGIQRVLKP